MATYLLKQGKKHVTTTVHTQISQTHCNIPLEGFSYTKHAKSCQDTTCQTYMHKQASNMAVCLLKQSKNASDSNGTCSNITNTLQCTTRNILVHQTCQNMSGYHLSNIYKETGIKHVSRPPESSNHLLFHRTAPPTSG